MTPRAYITCPICGCAFVESTLYPFIGGDTIRRSERMEGGLQPSVNRILPYASPEFGPLDPETACTLSLCCLENARNILLALETEYRRIFARNLTLSRLSEAVILPCAPDKGSSMTYDLSRGASTLPGRRHRAAQADALYDKGGEGMNYYRYEGHTLCAWDALPYERIGACRGEGEIIFLFARECSRPGELSRDGCGFADGEGGRGDPGCLRPGPPSRRSWRRPSDGTGASREPAAPPAGRSCSPHRGGENTG